MGTEFYDKKEFYNKNKEEIDKWFKDNDILTWGTPSYEWFVKDLVEGIDKYKTTKKDRILVGVCGNAGTGKDSATDFLRGVFPNNVVKMAFADPIRQIGEIFGFSPTQMSDRKLKEADDAFWQTSPRRFMQLVGTEMFRKQWREDVWTKLAEKRIVHQIYQDMVFVTDVRFPNEVECIKNLGGVVVRIKRDGFTKTGAELHDSEKFVNDLPVDFEIINKEPNSIAWSIRFTLELFKRLVDGCFFY